MRPTIWIYCILLGFLIGPQTLFAKPKRFAAGIDFGGSVDLLVSDFSIDLFGVGLGYQYSFNFSAWRDKPLGMKIRFEKLALRESNFLNTDGTVFQANTRVLSLEQNWFLYSIGIEKSYESHGFQGFWELLTGYASGGTGKVVLTDLVVDTANSEAELQNRSMVFLSGGWGLRREIFKDVHLTGSARTFLLLASIYKGVLSSKFVVPIPFIFSIGAEYQF